MPRARLDAPSDKAEASGRAGEHTLAAEHRAEGLLMAKGTSGTLSRHDGDLQGNRRGARASPLWKSVAEAARGPSRGTVLQGQLSPPASP